MADKPQIVMDIDVDSWTYEQRKAYKRAVGVNPQYALAQIESAIKSAVISRFDGKTEGMNALLDMDEDWLLGFVWMARRKSEPTLQFEQTWGEYEYIDLMDHVCDVWVEQQEAALAAREAAPLDVDSSDQTVQSNPPLKTDSPSSSSSEAESALVTSTE